MSDFSVTFLAVIIYMTLWYLLSSAKKRTDYVDIAWGGAFITIFLSGLVLNSSSVETPHLIIGACVIVWGLRLSYHIGRRNLSKTGEDPRYIAIKKKWKGSVAFRTYTNIFLLQGFLAWVISLPIIASWNVQTDGLGGVYIGLVVWVSGFLFESIADRQLAKFKQDPKNRGKVLQTGLWKYSRHPNYFGEITQWWGIWLMSLYLNPIWWSIIGPLLITYLIVFVSGLPPAERQMSGRKGYKSYARKTSALIPEPPKNT